MKTEPNMRSYIAADVLFGSKADMCSALGDVRFVPIADTVRCGQDCGIY